MGKRHRRTRESGSVRKLPSGKWQARVHHSDGTRTPLGTFSTKREADQSLTLATSDQLRGQWIDPRRGQRTFEEYSKLWLEQRPLRPRTTELYEYLLRLHICPRLGGFELAELTPIIVRQMVQRVVGRHHRSEHGCEVLPAPSHDPHDRCRGRAHHPEPVRDQGCRRGTKRRAAGRVR